MPRTVQAIHMGYSETQKGYVLYDPTNKVFFVNRDVTSREDLFPFKTTEVTTSSLFSIPSQLTSDESQNSEHSVLHETSTTINDASQQPESTTINDAFQQPDLVPPVIPNRRTSINETVQRKSTRRRHPPSWMKAFVSLNVHDVPYALSKYVSYDSLTPKYQNYLAAFSNLVEPRQLRIQGGWKLCRWR